MTKRRVHGEDTICFYQSSGLWVAQVTLPNGKRKTKYSENQKEVIEWLLGQRKALEDGKWVESDIVTLSAFLDRYMTDIAVHTRRPKTIESYEYLIRLNILPELGNVKLTALCPDYLQNLYSLKLYQGLVLVPNHVAPISTRNLIRHFKQTLEVAGLPKIRFHNLTYTHASLLLVAGVHPKLVQERLGHSQISLTLDTYLHVIPSLQKEAAEKMNELFK